MINILLDASHGALSRLLPVPLLNFLKIGKFCFQLVSIERDDFGSHWKGILSQLSAPKAW